MKKLIEPKGGEPLDTQGMKVSDKPIKGGVMMVNASVPPDHEASIVYRALTQEEKDERRIIRQDAAAFQRVNAVIFLRLKRDELLRATDFMESIEYGADWDQWRQELRDLPANVHDPEEPDFPYPPKAISCLYPNRDLWPNLKWKKFEDGKL